MRRILLTIQLVRPFGRLFTAPPETLEQLVAKLEKEIKEHQDITDAKANVIAEHHVAFLKTFLKHRPSMIESLREFGIKL